MSRGAPFRGTAGGRVGAGSRRVGRRTGVPGALTVALAAVVTLAGCRLVGAPSPEPPAAPPDPGPWEEWEEAPADTSWGRIPGPAPRPFREVRALWVVRTTLVDPDSIRAMVQRAHAAGFNTLLVQVRGRGDAYYRSRWEPRAEALRGRDADFDPLGLLVQEAHARGLDVHAWVNTHLVASAASPPTDARHIVRARPDLLAVPRELARGLHDMDPDDPRYVQALLEHARANSDVVEGLYTGPHHADVKSRVHGVWMDLAESYDLDGIHFDYVRYPNRDYDYSRRALEAFRSWVRPRVSPARRLELERSLEDDPLAYVEALPGPWREFRRAQITELVEWIYTGVKRRRPELVVSAAVFPDPEDAYEHRFQDWRGWLRRGILDVVAPMAYVPDDATFRARIAEAVEAAGDPDRVWAGIGVYRTTFDGTVSKIDIARELGARGVVLFSYDWAVHSAAPVGGRPFLEAVGLEAFGEGRRAP